MEHEEQAERMEDDAERMEEHSEQLGERIDDIESDWERKEQDPAVPGARPERTSPAPETSATTPELAKRNNPSNLGGVDLVRGPLKAGAAALFAVGLLLLFLNPPSLSGAEGMAVFVGGGIVLLFLTAWATVALMGSDAMPEDEFERLVRRSEELAATPGLRDETSDFDLLVADAIDDLPGRVPAPPP